MKKKNHTSHINRYILLGLSAFCVVMMLLSSFSDKVGGPFKVLANVTVIPLQQGINQIGGWMGDMKDNFSTLKQLQAENEKLQEQIDALTTENNYLQEERYEYERLQELYKLDQNYADYEKTAAHVIGKESGNWFSTFTIDKGSLSGVSLYDPVMTAAGLVGYVGELSLTTARVTTLYSPDCNVGAAAADTGDAGNVTGELTLAREGLVRMELIPRDAGLSAGSLLTTTGLTGSFPEGILVGEVVEVQMEESGISLWAAVRPAADIEGASSVFVVTGFPGKGAEEAEG